MSIEKIKSSKTADDFKEMLDIFLDDNKCEFFYVDKNIEDESSRWEKKFY